MAKKKKSIDLKEREIFFTIEKLKYQALRFYPFNMTVDVIEFDEEKKVQKNLPFAHLPKATKQIIKPKK